MSPTLRRTARVVPVTRSGRVLLLSGCNPRRPKSPYWFMIGGALETSENHEDAGTREPFEEIGVEVATSPLPNHDLPAMAEAAVAAVTP